MKRKRLGEVLRERGHVSAVDLNKALQEQKEQSKLVHLGELMLKRGLVAKEDLVSALMEISSIPYVDCTKAHINRGVLALIPAEMAWRCLALPIEAKNSGLIVAMAEPQNLQAVDELRFKTGRQIVPRLAFHGELTQAIEKHYGRPEPARMRNGDATGELQKEIEFISFSEQQRNIQAMREMEAELNQKTKTTPAVLVVASMIKAAAAKKASDIHIEPQSTETVIRFRIDGMLREYQRIARALQHTVPRE